MDITIITDSHLGNEKFVESGIRPKGFEDRILSGLRRDLRAEPSSILVHLGDVCHDNDEDWNLKITSRPGKKWLVLGNHDRKSMAWYISKGWSWVGESFTLTAFGKKILFSHRPMVVPADCDINIHGHFHDFSVEKIVANEPDLYALLTPKHQLITMEKMGYAPIKLKRVVELFEKKLL